MRTLGNRLVAQALTAEEAARRTVARELHDDVLQSLLAAHRAVRRAESGDRRALAHASEALALAVTGLRRQVSELHPPALDHAGLPAALRQVAQTQAGASGFDVHLDIDEGWEVGHRQVLFSLAREFLTNAAKHSHATHVWLRVARDLDGVSLEVRDNGTGFATERLDRAVAGGHIGLASSRERVEALRGSLRLESAVGEGTLVRVWLPARRGADGLNGASPPLPGPYPEALERRSFGVG